MKILATWFKRSRGMALGVLVGALTLGKASSYLINGIRQRELASQHNLHFIAGDRGVVTFLFVDNGPFALPVARFDAADNRSVQKSRSPAGKFWLLRPYVGTLRDVDLGARNDPREPGAGKSPVLAGVASFLVIGCGAIGCVVAGLLADRIGRTIVTSVAMGISGSCCLLIGFLFGGHPLLLLFVAAIWGATVVADSAQFSACVTELGNPQYIGTALTIQTCIGFLLTTISIEFVPYFIKAVGWRYAFVILAPGPLLGVIAMLRLRSLPEAEKIAHGRR